MIQVDPLANMVDISDMRLISLSEGRRGSCEKEHELVYMLEGKAALRSSSFEGIISEGDMVMLPAGSGEYIMTPVTEPTAAYYVQFASAVVSRAAGSWNVREASPAMRGMARIRPISLIRHRLEQLHRHWLKQQGYSTKLHIAWLELWDAISNGAMGEEAGLDSLIQSIIRHMDIHFMEPFQVEDMARYSGVTPSIFFKRFKEHTSLSPLQYLTHNRLEKARRMLVEDVVNIREVASGVGYQDVQYFSRMFKKMVGLPPYRYHQVLRKKIAVLSPPMFDNLLALGLPREKLIPFWNRSQQKNPYKQLESNGMELQWLQRVQPEMIIGTDGSEQMYDQLAEIAPTRLIAFKPYSWREHLRELAAILNAGEVAEYWLYYYEQKAAAVRERIRRRLGEQTVLAASVNDQGIRICGMKRRKIGRLLYGDLQLNAPKGTEEFVFADVKSLADLNDFKADHILLFQDRPLRAGVQVPVLGHVHHAGINPWLLYSALGHERSIEHALQYFA